MARSIKSRRIASLRFAGTVYTMDDPVGILDDCAKELIGTGVMGTIKVGPSTMPRDHIWLLLFGLNVGNNCCRLKHGIMAPGITNDSARHSMGRNLGTPGCGGYVTLPTRERFHSKNSRETYAKLHGMGLAYTRAETDDFLWNRFEGRLPLILACGAEVSDYIRARKPVSNCEKTWGHRLWETPLPMLRDLMFAGRDINNECMMLNF